MRAPIIIFIFLLFTAARADNIVRMKPGPDTFIFDFSGSYIDVDLDAEGIDHDYFFAEDMLEGLPVKPQLIAFGRTSGIQNAFAVIHNNIRYIVHDALFTAGPPEGGNFYNDRYLVLAHEMGHHYCGHTAGLMLRDPWGKELEADRFAGMLIRNAESHGHPVSLAGAIEAANELLSEEGSPTHPPRNQRIAAITEGYNNGSPCLGRSIPTVGDERSSAGITAAAGTKWDHNGSIMVLVANGNSRQFVYDTLRVGLDQYGMHKGTILFDGERRANRYFGKAFVFSSKCGSTPYPVSGPVSPDQRNVSVVGSAPDVDDACHIVGHHPQTLDFSLR